MGVRRMDGVVVWADGVLRSGGVGGRCAWSGWTLDGAGWMESVMRADCCSEQKW